MRILSGTVFGLIFITYWTKVSALCSTRQLDIARLQKALDTCRHRGTSPGPYPEPQRALAPTTEVSATLRIPVSSTSRPDNIVTSRAPVVTPPTTLQRAAGWIPITPPSARIRDRTLSLYPRGHSIIVPRGPHAVIMSKRPPRSFTRPIIPVQLNEATGAWEVGAHDKKCIFHCAFVELELMDEDGRMLAGQLKRFVEESAKSPQLKAAAGELAELCQYKMLHVSTIDSTQLECDYPLMMTRCILGRLSKHCEEEDADIRRRNQKEAPHNTAIHPDVEYL